MADVTFFISSWAFVMTLALKSLPFSMLIQTDGDSWKFLAFMLRQTTTAKLLIQKWWTFGYADSFPIKIPARITTTYIELCKNQKCH